MIHVYLIVTIFMLFMAIIKSCEDILKEGRTRDQKISDLTIIIVAAILLLIGSLSATQLTW